LTALVYGLSKSEVWLATDSLSLTVDGQLRKFLTKLYPLPHLSGAMVGTGLAEVALDWFVDIQLNIVAQNILYLNTVGPQRLREIARKYDHPGTSTIYHFGYDEDGGRFRGFALRSTHDYQAEEIVYGYGVKPYSDGIRAGLEDGTFGTASAAEIVRIVEEQKRLEDARPIAERVGIGGEVHLLALQQDRQILWVCHRFPDRQALFDQMLELLRREQPPASS
jgi:hypothetical protein